MAHRLFRDYTEAIGIREDAAASGPDENATIIALLKAIGNILTPLTGDTSPVVPNMRYSQPDQGIGAVSDPKATDATGQWSSISLAKAILERIQG